ncbi:MAG: division/cell wall cluster transcriptional repressor MraZ [Candidatus Gottesmanbacteria bacterium]
MKLFLGEYNHTLDERGRVTLPRKIRQELGQEQMVLTRGFDTCIFGYDLTAWEKEAAKQLETSVTTDEGRALRRYVFSAAEKVETDKLGRVILPTHLKEYAEITSEVKVIGAGDHFEIWDINKWKEFSKGTK